MMARTRGRRTGDIWREQRSDVAAAAGRVLGKVGVHNTVVQLALDKTGMIP